MENHKENNITRMLIETFVKKGLRDIKSSPKRSIRNLVDLALHAAKGRFQQYFFKIAQTMLQNEDSPYYDLIEHLVKETDQEHLLTLGMNVGYNSCTQGAKIIRAIEAEDGHSIPWCVTLKMGSEQLDSRLAKYQDVITQGEQLGIYTWLLMVNGSVMQVFDLAEAHPQSAFFLLCKAPQVTGSVLSELEEIKNIMPVLRTDHDLSELCHLLQNRRLQYSVYDFYTAEDTQRVTSGEWFRDAERLEPTFAALIADASCDLETRETVCQYVESARYEQMFQTIPLEWTADCRNVDAIISEDGYAVWFDEAGRLFTSDHSHTETDRNLFEDDLKSIFQAALPKA